MKQIIFTIILSFFAFAAFSQNASSSASQVVSLRLRDISIVEKTKPAQTALTNSGESLQVQSAGSWIITTKKINNFSSSTASAQQNNYILPVDNHESKEEMVYTLSKV